MNTFVSQTYYRLLTDIVLTNRVSLDTPMCLDDEWALIQGPKLEKEVLAYLEGRGPVPQFPEWLTPLWELFQRTDNPRVLRDIRQALLFCYKAEQQPTNEQLQHAEKAFEETDRDCDLWESNIRLLGPTIAAARRIVGSVIYRIDWSNIDPAHGPGAVFPPCGPQDKSRLDCCYRSIVECYPLDQFYCGLPNYWEEVLVDGDGKITEKERIVANLTAVPKDARGPRIICVHPKEAIWVQQGQRKLLEHAITRSPITGGQINFDDQSINASLALTSSKDRLYATIDLREASDRISCKLVELLFGPHAYRYISCGRATHVRLGSKRDMMLKKWAPMGNCLTFPVQSLIFYSLVVAGIEARYGLNCSKRVFVFGDDIIFPMEYYDGAVAGLVQFGAVPNLTKTFFRGFFRESCGCDAYKGIDVTPLRVKKPNIASLEGLISNCDLAKRLRLRGMDYASSFMYAQIRKQLESKGKYLPLCNNPNASGLIEYVNTDMAGILKWEPRAYWHRDTQQYVVPCLLVMGRTIAPQTDDWYHLQDSLLRLSRNGDNDSERGLEYAVPNRTRLKNGWTPLL